MFCQNCGKEMNQNQKFCSHCGKGVGVHKASASKESWSDRWMKKQLKRSVKAHLIGQIIAGSMLLGLIYCFIRMFLAF